ncbi:universal stress protein [Flavobacteriaceae bacterium 3-367]|uniref:universal stress protein n=1 Tax=Eudoraea algarum TaxID=3417568 RepID=UPI003280A07D
MKLLVPVDFSEHSAYALEVAATLARLQDGEIVVLHMMGLSQAVLTKDESQEYEEAHYYMKLAKKKFAAFLDREYLRGIRVTQLVQNYKIFSEINTVAKEQGTDLIVMGSHGISGLSDVFVGSNTEKVVRSSELPVLVIKERMPNFTFNKMVMAWHYKDESVATYRKARDFADAFGAQLHMVYINLPGYHFLSTREIEEKTSRFMQNTGINREVVIYDDYSVEQGLLHYAEKMDADIIAIATHGRKGLAHFLIGSIGEDIANHSKRPVVTFKM